MLLKQFTMCIFKRVICIFLQRPILSSLNTAFSFPTDGRSFHILKGPGPRWPLPFSFLLVLRPQNLWPQSSRAETISLTQGDIKHNGSSSSLSSVRPKEIRKDPYFSR